MDLASALAYNHKMRANVFYRAGRYDSARETYTLSLREFREMQEPRGEALSRLGLAKSRARLGRDRDETLAELSSLEADFTRIGLRHARDMVIAFRAELTAQSAPETPAPRCDATTPASPAIPARS